MSLKSIINENWKLVLNSTCVKYLEGLVCWLIVWVKRSFKTALRTKSGRLPERKRKKKRNDRREKKYPNNPDPHLRKAQYALAML